MPTSTRVGFFVHRGWGRYECDSCGGMQDAHRQLFLTRAPELLMITLKRFEYTRHGPRKLNRSVQFPLTGLDLTRFIRRKSRKGVPSPCSYHLCAMITHRGRPFGGHYFAYAFSQADNCWYCYDDDDVYSVRASTVAAEQAYILM
jgi:ubiquitin C-terminal hydrolase